jgi:hypothetical protein
MKFREGHHYILEFYDHGIGVTEPIRCQVSGWIVSDHKDFVKLTTWLVQSDDKEVVDNNLELVIILKTAIKDWHQIL